MTVKELIEELQKFDPEMEVAIEGCDCIGDAAGVVLYGLDDEDCVLITRPDSYRAVAGAKGDEISMPTPQSWVLGPMQRFTLMLCRA
jgi:hypothetical protein